MHIHKIEANPSMTTLVKTELKIKQNWKSK